MCQYSLFLFYFCSFKICFSIWSMLSVLCVVVLFVCSCVFLPACIRSLLACVLCCDFSDPHLQTELDPPFPSNTPSPQPSLTAAERPQTTLPLCGHSLTPGHWTVAVRSPREADVLGDRGGVAGPSCSTLIPSENMDMRRLLGTRRHQQGLGRLCPSALNCFRKNIS